MADILLLSEAVRAKGADEDTAMVRSFCEPLPSPDEVDAFGAFFDRFADAKVVPRRAMGTSEFYRSRAASRRIGPTPHASTATCATKRMTFPTWMWRNTEVRDFVEWLRGRNEHLPAEDRTEFRGLDIYSPGSSIAAVLAYLDRIDRVDLGNAG